MKQTNPNVNAELINDTKNIPAKIFFFKARPPFAKICAILSNFSEDVIKVIRAVILDSLKILL